MKIRIGFGLGTRTTTNDAEKLGSLVEQLEDLRFDSLWLSERIGGEAPDPVVGLTFAAARSDRLKLGTSVMVLPGRNPVLVAKELASLDRLSGGRLLPAFGLGVADPHEQQAFGVERAERARRFDEALPLIRRLWTGEEVTHRGEFYEIESVRIRPAPAQQPIDIWLGGIAPSELRRVGRLGDGWLPSFCTPREVAEGRARIEEVAAENDRSIDEEHFGALIAYRASALPEILRAFITNRRPGVDPEDVVPAREDLPLTIRSFIDAGASKFVLVPVHEADDWTTELKQIADIALPLQGST